MRRLLVALTAAVVGVAIVTGLGHGATDRRPAEPRPAIAVGADPYTDSGEVRPDHA
jgi:hypothetical protein